VQCRDQGGELVLDDVLHLVDEQREDGRRCLGRGARCFEESLQIVFEVAIVSESRLRLEVESYLDILVTDLQCGRKARERAQRSLSEHLRPLVARELQQCLPQPGSEDCRKR